VVIKADVDQEEKGQSHEGSQDLSLLRVKPENNQ
jgi:hypothetical protein